MTHRKTAPWIYVAGGAALGFVALGTAARQRRRLTRVAAAQSENVERSRLAGDVSDVPIPVQEALAASARVHGLDHPLSEELARDIFRQAAERRSVPGNEPPEVSSLVGPPAIAPDEDAAGDELADSGAIEVPLGQSAEPEIDRTLSHSKLLQADSSGSALLGRAAKGPLLAEASSLLDEPTDDGEFTAQPTEEARPLDEAYDAVAPEDLGSEWLTRATEGGARASKDDAPSLETAEALRDAGMSIVSQESLDAASADELEAAAATELEGATDDELLELDELLDEEDTTVREMGDAPPLRPPNTRRRSQ